MMKERCAAWGMSKIMFFKSAVNTKIQTRLAGILAVVDLLQTTLADSIQPEAKNATSIIVNEEHKMSILLMVCMGLIIAGGFVGTSVLCRYRYQQAPAVSPAPAEENPPYLTLN